MRQILLIAVLLLLSGTTLIAQQGTTSPYSFYGMGTTNFKGTAENRAMGGLSVASDSIHLNMLNPAGLADLELVNYTVGMSYQRADQKTLVEKQTATTTTFDYIAMGIPIGRFGVSFGLLPSTSVGYHLISNNDAEHLMEYEGSGGVNKAYLGLGVELIKNWNIGIQAGYNFGSIKNIGISRIRGVNYATRERNEFDVNGFDFVLGSSYTIPLSKGSYLIGSVGFSPKYDLNTENHRVMESILYSASGEHLTMDRRELDMVKSDLELPQELTFGLGYGIEKHWFLGAEYTERGKESFNSHSLALTNVAFKSSKAYRLGGYYIPNYRSFNNIFNRIVYRAGVRYEELGLSINGQDIKEFGISFGVGVPMNRMFSNINLGLEYGKRGTKSAGLIQENYLNVILTLSLNDKWFQKRYIY